MSANEDLKIVISAKTIYDSLTRLETNSKEIIRRQGLFDDRVLVLEKQVADHGPRLLGVEAGVGDNTKTVKSLALFRTKILVLWGGAVTVIGFVLKAFADKFI